MRGVIQRVANLFHGHTQLMLGFNAFLPEESRLGISDIEVRVEKLETMA